MTGASVVRSSHPFHPTPAERPERGLAFVSSYFPPIYHIQVANRTEADWRLCSSGFEQHGGAAGCGAGVLLKQDGMVSTRLADRPLLHQDREPPPKSTSHFAWKPGRSYMKNNARSSSWLPRRHAVRSDHTGRILRAEERRPF